MKFVIQNLLVRVLEKMDCTVIIGCKIEDGKVTCLRNDHHFYTNELSTTKLYYENGQEFTLPEGKFHFKSSLDKDSGEYVEWYRKVVNKLKKNKK